MEISDQTARSITENAAIEGYRAGKLSQRRVGAMLGLDYWQTEAFLSKHDVPLNYSAADLAADSATLEKFFRIRYWHPAKNVQKCPN